MTARALTLVTVWLAITACRSQGLPSSRGLSFRPDLKPAQRFHTAPHRYCRTNGERRFIKDGQSVRSVNVPGDFQSRVQVFRRGNQTVRLLAVLHVGERAYYAQLREQLKQAELVLYEDLKGASVVFAGLRQPPRLPPAWQSQAQALSPEHLELQGLRWRRADLSWEQLKDHWPEEQPLEPEAKSENQAAAQEPWSTPQRRHDWSLKLVQYQDVGEPPAWPRGLRRLSFEDYQRARPISQSELDYALIYRRNDEVERVLREALKAGQRDIALLYGAAHAYDLEQRLVEDLGFQARQRQWLTVWHRPKAE